MFQSILLPEGWKATLPAQDHKWVSQALFRPSKDGKPELIKKLQLWYSPPQPMLLCSRPPNPDRYFSQPLLLWMPYKLWQVQLFCVNEDCQKRQLTGAGIYRRVRQVLDIDRYFHLAAEYLECGNCHKKYISWSRVILDQLDIGHRSKFPVILTYKYDFIISFFHHLFI